MSEPQEVVDFGHGVVFARIREEGRLVGSDSRVDQQRGWIVLWARGKIERGTVYLESDEARAAAERLAEEKVRR